MLITLALTVTLAAAGPAPSPTEGAVTLQGRVLCAKCALKKAAFKECQNVLLVPQERGQGAEAEYYIVNNAVNEKFGEACMEAKKATVTGTVSEKDGLKWIAPTRMEPAAAEPAH